MDKRTPVSTLDELIMLDGEEIIAGYWEGRNGEIEPGGNHSKAFGHGWRNGAMDFGHLPHDDAARKLVHQVVDSGYLRRRNNEPP